MRRWLLLLAMLVGCKSAATAPDTASFPVSPTSSLPEPNWSDSVPAPGWSGSPAQPSPQAGSAFRVAPPLRPFDGTIELKVPVGVAPGENLPVRIDWQSKEPATIRHAIPDGMQLLRSDPPARLAGRTLEWNVAGGGGLVSALYQPARVGRFDFDASISNRLTDSALAQASTRVGIVQLKLRANGPRQASIGENISFEAEVTNVGQVAAMRPMVWADLDAGWENAMGSRRLELPLGQLAAGESKTVIIPATARRSGDLAAVISAQCESGATASESLHVEVREPKLAVALDGPTQLVMNQSATWTVRIINDGDAPAQNVAVRVQLPPDLKLAERSKAAWTIGTLRPREAATLEFVGTARAPVERTTIVASAVGDRLPDSRNDVTVSIVAAPMLKLSMSGSEAMVEVGQNVIYTIEAKNSGSMTLRDLEIVVEAPEILSVRHANGPTIARVEGSRIRFGRIAQLPPDHQVMFRLEVQALQPGDARIAADARSETLSSAVRQEIATRVVAK